jgi:hypothetical protein
MAPQAGTKLCKYVYAIVSHSQACGRYGPIGIEGGEVSLVSEGPVAAVVSDVPGEKIRPERRNLTAHHAVLRSMMQHFDLLPMSFGIMARDSDAIAATLRLNEDVLLRALRRIAGKVEMGLHVHWDVPNAFEYFVNTNEELRRLRDQLFYDGRDPSREDKIELGRVFAQILEETREEHWETISAVLSPRCAELKRNKPRDEREVVNLASLVDRSGTQQFEEAVLEAARLFDNNFTFDYNGPWPVFSFADVTLQMPDGRE